jgi:hypothetical protein
MPKWERETFARYLLGRRMTEKEKACFLKRRHTEEYALAEVTRQRHLGYPAHAYRCDDCGEWHVGGIPS